MPHIPPPHPPIPQFIGPAMGSDADDALDPFTWAEAGTLNCFSRSIEPHEGQCGTSCEDRTSVSKVFSQGSQRYS
jgi:hypothetical protein